ncbi:hypothetical protein [Lacticaseibacillus rhamnosus]|uniref:hypothetical protein n=1 Tax=Lacticaseibacillus rhamnosus TaxID=47715 RepID=UPI000532CFB9|nr:hypothetical protein [Lacticaseibacillus rhamnosus]
MKIKRLLRDFSYSISSNLISLAVSTLVVLIVPKFIGVTEYGYWQLYIFYTNYVGVLHFGWLDGIFLRYGGYHYEELDRPTFFSQFIQFLIFQLFLSIVLILIGLFSNTPENKYIIIATAVAMVLINLMQFFLYILQDTSRIKEYAIVTTIGRVLYFLGVLVCLVGGVKSFQEYIIADLVGRAIALMYAVYSCREIVFLKLTYFSSSLKETWRNLSVGVKLLLANFASNLIIGVVRYGIQLRWGVRVFGKVSLTLNISGFLMTFISAISLVLYPVLRRMKEQRLRQVYTVLKTLLVFVLLLGLFVYYPLAWVLPVWLPKYADALKYMAILFPMCVYSGKFSLLIVTFMKTYRLEKKLLTLNLGILAFSVALTVFNVFIVQNLTLTMVSMVLILGVQSAVGEVVLERNIGMRRRRGLLLETLVVALFVSGNYIIGGAGSLIIYMVAILTYYLINKGKIFRGVKLLLEH